MKFTSRRLLGLKLFTVFAVVTVTSACAGGQPSERSVANAFRMKATKVQVEDEGTVTRVLRMDTSGIPHQRFIIQTASGQTILIEHNTEIAPAIEDLHIGAEIRFCGEYIWNEQGGLVHWTHHDPEGKHQPGWLKYNNIVFQ